MQKKKLPRLPGGRSRQGTGHKIALSVPPKQPSLRFVHAVDAWQPTPLLGSRFKILSLFPLRLRIGVGYREGTHVEAGFP
jgi:hypothetical protein